MKKIKSVFVFAVLSVFLLAAGSVQAKQTLMMATTTSTDNTGLLDVLAPMFEKDTGIELKWTAVGTGKALKMGDNCDVDVLLVHAPAAEQKYVDSGALKDRRELMYNDFVIIGPASDPAGIKGLSVADALKKISSSKAVFVSRGDNSGTNKKEIFLWKSIGNVPDKQDWYIQVGQGMIKTINIAEERGGYTMTDRGTYIKYESNKGGNPDLKILVEGDKILFNQYSVLAVNPEHCPKTQYGLASKFAEWMASKKTQKEIGDFRLLGKQLFTPNAQ
ncbi:substrate-binding domain-containing protein [Maridesulfovibrio bastinii]|jgi:tungstate transport system substrate-binding protein|uniref:substrate-binding domain-containing protein n=1 Tax=Maridesulfovibrio bastinii TaxID=47157 RepID=UPI000415E9CA|nr:substrate-binding domain-containing protein [Maridesulfovibrio bastinii]